MKKEKFKVLLLSDDLRCASGVGGQSRMLVEALVSSGKFSVKQLGGAMKHPNYDVQVLHPDIVVKPVDGFGTPNLLRQLLITERPDVLVLFTDPRQFVWVWQMEDEINQICPIVYWHVWDNDPYPEYNSAFYESTEVINCISMKTYNLLKDKFPAKVNYLPHVFPKNWYYELPKEEIDKIKAEALKDRKDWFVTLWVNRNAHRKMPADVLHGFKLFLDLLQEKEGHRNAVLVMHTNPKDPEGPDLEAVAEMLKISDRVMFSVGQIDIPDMNRLYNVADTLVNVSRAEGFGLCLDGKTKITTKDGIKNMSDINIGDFVLSADGTYNKVLAKANRKEKTIVKIRGARIKEIISSKEHPFLICENPSSQNKKFIWKPAAEIQKNDFLCIPKNREMFFGEQISEIKISDVLSKEDLSQIIIDDNSIYHQMGYTSKPTCYSIKNISDVLNIKKHHAEVLRKYIGNIPQKRGIKIKNRLENQKQELFSKLPDFQINKELVKVNNKIKLDKDFFRVFGWYLAEGSVNKNSKSSLEFSLNKDELETANWLKSYFETIFNVKGSVQEFGNKCRFVCSSSIVAKFFASIARYGAFNKEISSKLLPLLANKEMASNLLKGLFLGDGHFSKNKKVASFTTISPKLLNQVNEILHNFNISPGFCSRKANPKNGQKESYVLSFSGREYEKLCEMLEIKANKEKKKQQKCYDDIYYTENKIFVPVKNIEIETLKEEIDLYDIQVQGTQNFVANQVVVHNSVLQMLSIGKPVVALKTGGMTDQLVDEFGNEHGVALEPVERYLVGSQATPYIYDDHFSKKELAEGLYKVYKFTPEEKETVKSQAKAHVEKQFNYDSVTKQWIECLEKTITNWRIDIKEKNWGLIQFNAPKKTMDKVEINKPKVKK